jgi:hypothetical protein
MRDVLKSADAERQVNGSFRHAPKRLTVFDDKFQPVFPHGRQQIFSSDFNHARRQINPDAALEFTGEGQQMMAGPATYIEHNVFVAQPGVLSNQAEPVFEQARRIAMLLVVFRSTLVEMVFDVGRAADCLGL